MARKRGRPRGPMAAVDEAAVLRAAGQLFAQRGYAGVSVSAVAHSAGVDKKSVYYHIGNKSRLFAASAVWCLQARRARWEPILQGPGPVRDRFRQAAYTAFLEGHPTDWEPLSDATGRVPLEDLDARRVQGEIAATRAILAQVLAAAGSRGELRTDVPPAVAAELFLRLLAAASSQRGAATTPATRADWVVSLWWEGLASPQGAPAPSGLREGP
jgi:AcrR family transcriptional regulator